MYSRSRLIASSFDWESEAYSFWLFVYHRLCVSICTITGTFQEYLKYM